MSPFTSAGGFAGRKQGPDLLPAQTPLCLLVSSLLPRKCKGARHDLVGCLSSLGSEFPSLPSSHIHTLVYLLPLPTVATLSQFLGCGEGSSPGPARGRKGRAAEAGSG